MTFAPGEGPERDQTPYRQCELTKPGGHVAGLCVQIVWIPAKFAVAGQVLKIRDRSSRLLDPPWEDGWTVARVFDGKRIGANIDQQQYDARRFKKRLANKRKE